MTERELFLGLAADIISAHVSNNAMPADQLPTLIQQVFNTLSTAEQKATDPPKAEPAVAHQAVGESGSPCVPRLRQALLDAQAASDDRPQTDAGSVPGSDGDCCRHIRSSLRTMRRHDPRWRRSLVWVGKVQVRGRRAGSRVESRSDDKRWKGHGGIWRMESKGRSPQRCDGPEGIWGGPEISS